MKKILLIVAIVIIALYSDLHADPPFYNLSKSGDTASGPICEDTDAGTNACFLEDGIDRNSATAETFDIRNSGAGSMSLRVDGQNVLVSPALSNFDFFSIGLITIYIFGMLARTRCRVVSALWLPAKLSVISLIIYPLASPRRLK